MQRSIVLALAVLCSGVQGANPGVIAISELHYHPVTTDPAAPFYEDEFIELYNTSREPVDLSGWFFDQGVTFTFPELSVIDPLGFAVIARNPTRFAAMYPGTAPVFGPYEGLLENDGEKVALRNREGHLADRVAYRDDAPWPENPDGLGPSLERTDYVNDGEQQWVWRASIPTGGTPGARNSTLSSSSARTLIPIGHSWKYFKGESEPAAAWAATTFSDTAWASGPSGFGYGEGTHATTLSDMRGNYSTFYIRARFTLTDPASVQSLLLSVVYDDAFVAYLNGTEIRRSSSAGGTPGTPPAYDDVAADGHAYDDGADVIELAGSPLLRTGANVVALQGLNASLSFSGDFTLNPTLEMTERSGGAVIEPPHDVEINEVVAAAAPANAYVELYNEGASTADLAGFRLTVDPRGGGGYTFPAGTTLQSGKFLVVRGNQLPFAITDTAQWLCLATADGRFVDGVRTVDRPAGRPWGRYPDGDGDTWVLDTPTAAAANALTPETRVVITEVRYHPPLAEALTEYVELLNRSAAAVDLSGWSLAKAVKYTFQEGSVLMPNARMVIAGNPEAVQLRYGITGVLGPWAGKLANSNDKIELRNDIGNRADVVNYADDGSWPASTLTTGPDGFGNSIELVNPAMENNHGSAWAASTGTGTPGAANSQNVADPPPVIRSPAHSPTQPRSTDTVTVTARVTDERGAAQVQQVQLLSRVDGAASFTTTAMTRVGGTDTYAATIAPRASGTVMQFYVRATDTTGHARTYPAAAPNPTLLLQFDDDAYPATLPHYRVILRDTDLTELATRDITSNVLLDCTFIHHDDIFYNVGIRYRGEHAREAPEKSFRVDFNHDQRFDEITRLNLNVERVHRAHLTADFWRRADMPGYQSRMVSFSLNRLFNEEVLANIYYGGIAQHVEAIDEDFVARYYPKDDGGNLYRGLETDNGNADLIYMGEDPAPYVPIYEKHTNEEANDYTDIIELARVLTETPAFPADAYLAAVEPLIDIENWAAYFAGECVYDQIDGDLATGTDEDYFLYHRPSDGRWMLIPWDLAETWHNPGTAFFRVHSAVVRRLLRHPAVVGAFMHKVREYLDGVFDPTVMAPRIDYLRQLFPAAEMDAIATFVVGQQAALRARLPEHLTVGLAPVYFTRIGDTWHFFRGTEQPPGGNTAWTARTYDDGAWEQGPAPIGYGDGKVQTVLDDMQDNYTTVFARAHFSIADPTGFTTLWLSVDYDDAFVAYLNGTEIARGNVTGTVLDTTIADATHEASGAERIDAGAYRNLLVAGDNVLALAGVNRSLTSSDLVLSVELCADTKGYGCDGTILVAGSAVALGGEAPIGTTTSVTVNGQSATYLPGEGTWTGIANIGPTGTAVTVEAKDADGAVIASQTVQVEQGAPLTNAGGTIASSRWTHAQSPYVITSDLTIPAGVTLTIDPGVIVYVAAGRKVVVQGTLNAAGTTALPIAFRASVCDGEWLGLQFSGASARALLQYCELRHVAAPTGSVSTPPAAVAAAQGAQIVLEHCSIVSAAVPGVAAEGSATTLGVRDTTIDDCAGGVYADSAYALVERTDIRNLRGAEDGIRLENGSSPISIVRDCIVAHGAGDGIALRGSGAQIDGAAIHAMGGAGLRLQGAAGPSIARALVYDCATGTAACDGVNATLTQCTFALNGAGLHVYEANAGAGAAQAVADSLIVWGNGSHVLRDAASTATITYSDVEHGFSGTGNGDFDPLFADAAAGDFRLRPGSGAIGTGKNGVTMGALPALVIVPGSFRRGDANDDARIDISDAVGLLRYLFLARPVGCVDALDTNDDGRVNVADAVRLLGSLFGGQGDLPAPFRTCGTDQTADQLNCTAHASCGG